MTAKKSDYINIRVPRSALAEALKIKLYIVTDHDLKETGAKRASYVLAYNEDEARELLDIQLTKNNLQTHAKYPYTLQEVPLSKPVAEVIVAG